MTFTAEEAAPLVSTPRIIKNPLNYFTLKYLALQMFLRMKLLTQSFKIGLKKETHTRKQKQIFQI